MSERFVKFVRLSTGDHVARAHVIDRETGSVVATCGHEHKTIRHRGQWDPSGAPSQTTGTALAERCGDKLLRRFLKSRTKSAGLQDKSTGDGNAE